MFKQLTIAVLLALFAGCGAWADEEQPAPTPEEPAQPAPTSSEHSAVIPGFSVF